MKSSFGQLSISVILVLFSNIVIGQDSLVTKSYLNNKIQISVPSSLKELDKKIIADRFPNSKARPFVLLTDKEELTSLKIIEMPQEVSNNEVGQYKGFHMSQMKKEPNLQLLGDGLKKINNKNVGFIKVIYTDQNTFAYFFFTSLNGKLLLLTYNCPDKLWPSMESTAEKIVNSLKVE
jgi:hypothetical protein